MAPHLILLAAAGTTTVPDDNSVTPGLLGFLVVVALGLGVWMLARSLNKHLRKIGPRPEDQSDVPRR